MINQTSLIYAGGIAGITFIARVWTKLRQERRAKRDAEVPLFDLVPLEIALTAREGDNDDPSVLAEIRETLAHLNRRGFAEEFDGLDKQLTAYYARLPEASRPTMRRALVRMIASTSPGPHPPSPGGEGKSLVAKVAGRQWVILVAAKTCANLSLREAKGEIESLLAERGAGASESAADRRYFEALEAAASKL